MFFQQRAANPSVHWTVAEVSAFQAAHGRMQTQAREHCLYSLLAKSHALEVFDSNKAPIKPAELLKHMLQIASRSKAGRQEDAHEFLIHFLDSCPQHVSLSFSHLLHFLVKSCCKFPGIEVSVTSTWGLCLSCQVPQISAETGSAATSSNSAELSEGSFVIRHHITS